MAACEGESTALRSEAGVAAWPHRHVPPHAWKPGGRYGLVSAFFVCFTLGITDFGFKIEKPSALKSLFGHLFVS